MPARGRTDAVTQREQIANEHIARWMHDVRAFVARWIRAVNRFGARWTCLFLGHTTPMYVERKMHVHVNGHPTLERQVIVSSLLCRRCRAGI